MSIVAERFLTIFIDKHDAAIAERLLMKSTIVCSFYWMSALGYLNLNRLSNSLSGGESQRINLVTLWKQPGRFLIYLDEPRLIASA